MSELMRLRLREMAADTDLSQYQSDLLAGAAVRINDLEIALGLALRLLEVDEPKDSRKVSPEFVAMAAVLADITTDTDRGVIIGRTTVVLSPKQAREWPATLYDELIYAVSQKHEGESRHETALRYIREREEQMDCYQFGTVPAAAKQKSE